MDSILQQISMIESEFGGFVVSIKNQEDLKICRAKLIGKKGSVTELLKTLGTLPAEERPFAGKKINELRDKILSQLDEAERQLQSANIDKALADSIDITLPGRISNNPGRIHPVTWVMRTVEEMFTGLGFSVYEGPEIESEYYNFEALNVPKNHPARDMQDTFYIKQQTANNKKQEVDEELLLRTHTSPVQIHVMEKFKPPIRMIFPGAVYRRDADITHSPMFHQVEGLMVGTGITMAHLKGVLSEFAHQMFGGELAVRFRPSFFPFTEPSAEMDIQCMMCKGKKVLSDGSPCRVCKQTGWMEILGCGMVNPAVFEAVGYDPKKVTGFAFGMGIERIAMLKFGISDIRMFFENDLRFLWQF